MQAQQITPSPAPEIDWPGAIDTGITSHDREGWLRERRGSIGASEVAAVMGLLPPNWGTPLQVYLDKVGALPEQDAGEAAEWGLMFEAPILSVYAGRVKHRVACSGHLYRSRTRPWLHATLDGIDLDAPEPLEVKTFGETPWHKPQPAFDWSEGPPVYVQAQVQTQLYVTGAEAATVIWLPLPSRKLQWCRIAADRDVQAGIVETLEQFWARVEQRRPPDPSGTGADLVALGMAFAEPSGETVQLEDTWVEAMDRYKSLGQEARELGKQRDAIKEQLAARLREATFGELPDGRCVSYKRIDKAEHVVAASSFRRVYVHKQHPERKGK